MAQIAHTDNLLITLLAKFAIPTKNYVFQPLTQGYINDTFLVLDDIQPKYILQRVNDLVFPNVKGLMNNIENAFTHLEDTDYQKIELVPTQDGLSYYEHTGPSYWRLMTYIDASTTFNTTLNPNIAQEAGRIIGKFHILLQEANTSLYVDTIPRFHDLELRSDQFRAALITAEQNKLSIAKDTILFAEKTLATLSAMTFAALPVRICHNDTKLNNILFSKTSNTALCLIDLDTLMKGYFHFDFGDAVRTIANSAPEDEPDHSKITFEKDMFEAFIHGLAANGPFLLKEEIDVLPMGVVLMPFLHGIRALTDYLNNNVYYKVAYKNQNLDRSRSLFDFTQKALNHIGYMEKVVETQLFPLKK